MTTVIGRDTVRTGSSQTAEQYSLAKILSIWAVVALPMPILAFVVAPLLSLRINLNPGIVVWFLMIVGMMWQFVVSLWLVYQDLGTLRWSAIKERTWLNAPRDPKTGEPNLRLFWWLLPALVLVFVIIFFLGGFLGSATGRLFPALTRLPSLDLGQLAVAEFIGAWWLVGVALLSCVFNYFLGEEFLFRGVLLPKMRAAFGKWDWIANAVLFGFYHLHKPLGILSTILTSLVYSWTSKRYQSNWFAIVLHGVEGLVVIGLVLAVVTGLAF